MGRLLHLVQQGGAWAGCGPAQSLLAVPNVTAHPSTASVPITVLPYDGPLLCGFNVAIKGLINVKPSATGSHPSAATPHLQRLQRCHANEILLTQRTFPVLRSTYS